MKNFYLVFIFAAVVEYALVAYFFHKPDRIERKNKERTPPTTPSNAKNGRRAAGTTTNGDLVDHERRFSMSSLYENPIPNLSEESNQNNGISMGQLWNKALSLAVPPFEMVKPRRRALRIDRLSRIFFPIAFISFNILYWSVLLSYSYKS